MPVQPNKLDSRDTERARYNERSRSALLFGQLKETVENGAEAIPRDLRTPYLRYEAVIRAHARPGARLLDLCCGTGLHSLTGARLGMEVTGIDVAEQALKVAAVRAERAGVHASFVTADAEALPFPDHHFDVVSCAGGLSYVNLSVLLGELQRVLRPEGAFVFVDSLNHNPIYRLNRYWRYLRGQRSRSTLQRMLSLQSLERVQKVFPDLDVSYHGIFSFAAPLLRVCGPDRAAQWLDSLDAALPRGQRFAFKVVGVGHLDRPTRNVM